MSWLSLARLGFLVMMLSMYNKTLKYKAPISFNSIKVKLEIVSFEISHFYQILELIFFI